MYQQPAKNYSFHNLLLTLVLRFMYIRNMFFLFFFVYL